MITLPVLILDSLIHLAQHESPYECCGFIKLVDGRAETITPVKNVAADRRHQYQMDPKEQMVAMQRLGDEFAIYHSHINAHAWPSQTDINRAYYDCPYVIVSLAPKCDAVKVFSIKDGTFEEQPVHYEVRRHQHV